MQKDKRIQCLLVVCLGLVVCLLTACSARQVNTSNLKESKDYLHAGEQDMQRWREMKFGLFIHWGPVSLKGTEIGWSRGGERRGRSGTGSIPAEEYDNLYKQFNPVKFNADEWIQVARDAGMKYLVFTSKHHDGFSMFDSKLTDYKITNSPFKRDVVKELADACHKAGLKLGFYYSPVDWYHPDYRTENHSRYIEFLHGQIRELCTNYGRLDILWFDGLGGSAKDWDSENLFRMIRRLQPHIIINNRAGLPADHDTPEQRIGKFQTDRPWETCMTICRQWAWKPNDQMKSLKQCIQTLVWVVGGDGNLLFNVGPMPDGRIEPRQVERLKEMGDWLKKYGHTIYGTRGGPFKNGTWGLARRYSYSAANPQKDNRQLGSDRWNNHRQTDHRSHRDFRPAGPSPGTRHHNRAKARRPGRRNHPASFALRFPDRRKKGSRLQRLPELTLVWPRQSHRRRLRHPLGH